jgi:CRP-like cAMP-binding protein
MAKHLICEKATLKFKPVLSRQQRLSFKRSA